MLRSGWEVVVSVWEGWKDGDGHGCEVANDMNHSAVDHEAEVAVFVLLMIARDLKALTSGMKI